MTTPASEILRTYPEPDPNRIDVHSRGTTLYAGNT